MTPTSSLLRRRRPRRVAWWLTTNVLLFFSVAVTNGFVVFFFALLTSCLVASWMATPFLLLRPHASRARRGTKWLVVWIGILTSTLLANGHPLFVAAIYAVTLHEMRVLDRYTFGLVAAAVLPTISILPIVPMSHAAYSELVLDNAWADIDGLVGTGVVVVLLSVTIVLLKQDDHELLPLIGKAEADDGFEKVGMLRWRRRTP